MTGQRKFLAATKITVGWKIQLPKDVREALSRQDKKEWEIGEKVAFYLTDSGDIVVRRA